MAGKKARKLRTIAYTKTFKKDHARMAAAGRYDITLVNQAGGLLIAHAEQQTLSSQWADHALTASVEWDDGDHDMHLGGDFLLIYRIDPHPDDKSMEIVIFKRLGTYSDLCG
ncbi:MAG: type II toxin-antitoxin system YafQ family toxin [Burkholderiaceae bacterium]|jgi:mRNA interferase YafQ|nr:type II toxin-antitoxin system YafQ family toxin [Burkholderiaceae bacterium]